ncbi:amidohydrolase family protein [Streptomyces albidoflavus]|uniref:amidohydrolase family protein n=1 Tax=Streptomyces TaxID=1883 RepID=UPI00069F2FC7|nr:amidohydrolase family protein [Streptomyces sp. KE1]
MQVLSLTPPGVQMQPDAAIAVRDAQHANDAPAAVVAAHPTRFGGLAALPLQNPKAAVREARRAMRDLGMAGFLVNGHTCGEYLDSPRFRPVWAALEELGAALYLRPTPAPAGDWEITRDRPELVGPLYSWAAETAGHAMHVIVGGVFDEFPGARLILGHMGEFLPFPMPRLDQLPAQRAPVGHPPREDRPLQRGAHPAAAARGGARPKRVLPPPVNRRGQCSGPKERDPVRCGTQMMLTP